MQTDSNALVAITGLVLAALVALVGVVLDARRRGRMQLDWTNPATGKLRLLVDEDDTGASDSRRRRKQRKRG